MTRGLVNDPAFDFDELRFDWGHVILAAVGWGEWQRLERSLADGPAPDAEDRGEDPDADTLRAATATFRRARGLLAGEDYLRWLSERSLSPDDVQAHLARRWAPGPGELTGAAHAEAILSGSLQRWAERLVRCAAAARGLAAGGQPPTPAPSDVDGALLEAAAACGATGLSRDEARDRGPRIAALQSAERSFADRVLTRERIEHCLAGHQLDWQWFAWEEVTFAGEGAAREAALLVREDGTTLSEVAGLARLAAGVREAYADELPELAGLLAAAAPGELLGPLAGEDGWRLVLMRERKPPAIGDSVLEERAGNELVEDALGRYMAGRVRWHVKH